MKRDVIFIAVMLLMFCSNSVLGQTKKRSTTKRTSTTRTVSAPKWTPIDTEIFEYADSSEVGNVSMKIELPSGADEESQRLRASIWNLLSTNLGADSNYGGGEDGNTPAYTGPQDVKAMCKYFSDAILRRWNREVDPEELNSEYFCHYECDVEFNKIDETARYVVFDESIYGSEGGAHGGIFGAGALTYDRSTGELLTDILKPNVERSMQSLLRRGLKSYFCENEGKRSMTDRQLMENLDGCENGIPLPKAYNVYPSKKGLVFIYAQYEIACYAAGMPNFVVPYSQVKPYLTTAAKKLFGLQ